MVAKSTVQSGLTGFGAVRSTPYDLCDVSPVTSIVAEHNLGMASCTVGLLDYLVSCNGMPMPLLD